VAALAYAAINLHILSLKVFLSGHIVAAGNLFRQVLESIALALLCSSKNSDVLDRFMADKYTTNNAIRDVLRKWRKLGLKADAKQPLERSQEFYHKYSHISRLTLGNFISFSEPGLYVGTSFDKAKIDEYRREVNSRVNLAEVFENFVAGVKQNVSQW
jgi:hypothetical protein